MLRGNVLLFILCQEKREKNQNKEMSTTSSIPCYCHGCQAHSNASTNEDGELFCIVCSSPFVEEENQGGEEFFTDATIEAQGELNQQIEFPQNNSSTASEIQHDHSRIIQQVLDNLLGIGTQQQSNFSNEPISIVQRGSDGSRRPVGIMIRSAPLSLDGSNGSFPRGLLGLLGSVGASRINNYPNPDALSNAQFEQFLHHILMNESSHAGAPPADEHIIQQLERHKISCKEEISTFGVCCISQDEFEIGDIVISLPCGHNYKEDPIVHWLKMHSTCPVCRINIKSKANS